MTTARRSPVTGVCPVLETPFHPDGRVDLDGFRRVCRHVASLGIDSVMYPGFASEYHKLSEGERGELMDALFEELPPSGPVGVVVAVQDHATVLAEARVREARRRGARAINILPPHFLAPSPAAIRAHVRAVLTEAGELPVIVQYAPAETGAALAAGELRALATEFPNLAAVKVESRPSGPMMAELVSGEPSIPGIEGYAGILLPHALDRGAIAVQPGCSFVEIYIEIWRRHTAGDADGAAALHTRLLPYLSYWMNSVELIVAAEKLISQRRGLIASEHCRAPGRALDAVEVTLIERFLAEFAEFLPTITTV